MMAAVVARHPDREVIGFARDGLRPDESFQANLTAAGAGPRHAVQAADFNPVRDADLVVFLNPATGAVLGERPFWGPMRIVYWLHKELLAPFAGAPWLGALGIVLLGLIVAGVITWWPRPGQLRRSLRVVTDRGARRLWRDLHTAAGAMAAILILASTATGVFMCYEIKIEGLFEALGLAIPARPLPASRVTTGAPAISVQAAVDAALKAHPGFDPVLVNLPASGRGIYGLQLFPRTASRVWRTLEVGIDAADGRQVGLFDPDHQPAANSLPLWIIFLHNGQMFGAAGRFVVLIEGLVLAGLTISGPWLWWMRHRAARAGR
jgi:uncharacterized iron-regulated membrane protein